MTVEPAVAGAVLESVRADVDVVLDGFLRSCASELEAVDTRASMLVEEIERLVFAGGKRLRPAFCIWGFRAARGDTGLDWAGAQPPRSPIVHAAAALELLHTMALIHDDLIDAATERRGVAASAPHLVGEAIERGFHVDPGRFGHAAALIVGDLAAVLADRLFLGSGFEPGSIVRALDPYHAMRLEMAAGQLLDIAGLASEPEVAMRAARLRGGTYTVEGPLLVGAALANDRNEVGAALRAFGAPLGLAFQLRDDLMDGEGTPGATTEHVNGLVARARDALHDARHETSIDPEAASALDALAAMVTVS